MTRYDTVRGATAVSALGLLLAAGTASATNGYFVHGFGVKDKGLAGAGTAYPHSSMAAATNPAGMAFVGQRADAGVAWFSPRRTYTTTGEPSEQCDRATGQCTFSIGPQSLESDNENFIVPQFGYNHPLTERDSIGVTLVGNGGMNTEYKGGTATFFDPRSGGFVEAPGTFGAGTTGVNLAQAGLFLTYSRKLTEDHAVGISGIAAYQTFRAQGIDTFGAFSLEPNKLSGNRDDEDLGFGFKLGYQGEIYPGVRIGAAFQPEIDASFDKYEGLFANQGEFDIPANASIGVSWAINERNRIDVDVQKIFFSDVPALGNDMQPLFTDCQPANPVAGTPAQGDGCLGGDDGAGFGWDDMTVFKIGYELDWGPGWTWRVGYSNGDAPMSDDCPSCAFNLLAPATIEEHVTFGFTKAFGETQELNFSAMWAPEKEFSRQSAFDPNQTVEIEMHQFELAVGYSWLF